MTNVTNVLLGHQFYKYILTVRKDWVDYNVDIKKYIQTLAITFYPEVYKMVARLCYDVWF